MSNSSSKMRLKSTNSFLNFEESRLILSRLDISRKAYISPTNFMIYLRARLNESTCILGQYQLEALLVNERNLFQLHIIDAGVREVMAVSEAWEVMLTTEQISSGLGFFGDRRMKEQVQHVSIGARIFYV